MKAFEFSFKRNNHNFYIGYDDVVLIVDEDINSARETFERNYPYYKISGITEKEYVSIIMEE